MKFTILSVGKTKESWLRDAVGEYVKRLGSWASVEMLSVKDDRQLAHQLATARDYICLDEKGEMMTSPQLANWVALQQEKMGAHLVFVIGGADGLPEQLKRGHPMLSLSRLTLTHQMVRLLLVEQLYRALAIQKGLPYHRD